MKPDIKQYTKMEWLYKAGSIVIVIGSKVIVIQMKKETSLSKKYFDMMSSTVLSQLNFYLQKFIF